MRLVCWFLIACARDQCREVGGEFGLWDVMGEKKRDRGFGFERTAEMGDHLRLFIAVLGLDQPAELFLVEKFLVVHRCVEHHARWLLLSLSGLLYHIGDLDEFDVALAELYQLLELLMCLYSFGPSTS
jgi:hypothetical protein